VISTPITATETLICVMANSVIRRLILAIAGAVRVAIAQQQEQLVVMEVYSKLWDTFSQE
jgi:hypothetical protein